MDPVTLAKFLKDNGVPITPEEQAEIDARAEAMHGQTRVFPQASPLQAGATVSIDPKTAGRGPTATDLRGDRPRPDLATTTGDASRKGLSLLGPEPIGNAIINSSVRGTHTKKANFEDRLDELNAMKAAAGDLSAEQLAGVNLREEYKQFLKDNGLSTLEVLTETLFHPLSFMARFTAAVPYAAMKGMDFKESLYLPFQQSADALLPYDMGIEMEDVDWFDVVDLAIEKYPQVFEQAKISNLPLFKSLETLMAAQAYVTGYDPFKEFTKASKDDSPLVASMKKAYNTPFISNEGTGRLGAAGLGFLFEVFADPITYTGFGAIPKLFGAGGKAATKAGLALNQARNATLSKSATGRLINESIDASVKLVDEKLLTHVVSAKDVVRKAFVTDHKIKDIRKSKDALTIRDMTGRGDPGRAENVRVTKGEASEAFLETQHKAEATMHNRLLDNKSKFIKMFAHATEEEMYLLGTTLSKSDTAVRKAIEGAVDLGYIAKDRVEPLMDNVKEYRQWMTAYFKEGVKFDILDEWQLVDNYLFATRPKATFGRPSKTMTFWDKLAQRTGATLKDYKAIPDVPMFPKAAGGGAIDATRGPEAFTSHKTYKNVEERLAAGHMTELDLRNILNIRSFHQARAVSTKRFIHDVVNNPDISLRITDETLLTDMVKRKAWEDKGWDVFTFGAKDPTTGKMIDGHYLMPKAIVDKMTKTRELYLNPKKVADALGAFDFLNATWKGWAVFSPGFHMRNGFNAFHTNWLAGIGTEGRLGDLPFGLGDAIKAMIPGADRKHSSAIRLYLTATKMAAGGHLKELGDGAVQNLLRKFGDKVNIEDINKWSDVEIKNPLTGKVMSPDEVWDEAVEIGVVNKGWLGADQQQALANIFGSTTAAGEKIDFWKTPGRFFRAVTKGGRTRSDDTGGRTKVTFNIQPDGNQTANNIRYVAKTSDGEPAGAFTLTHKSTIDLEVPTTLSPYQKGQDLTPEDITKQLLAEAVERGGRSINIERSGISEKQARDLGLIPVHVEVDKAKASRTKKGDEDVDQPGTSEEARRNAAVRAELDESANQYEAAVKELEAAEDALDASRKGLTKDRQSKVQQAQIKYAEAQEEIRLIELEKARRLKELEAFDAPVQTEGKVARTKREVQEEEAKKVKAEERKVKAKAKAAEAKRKRDNLKAAEKKLKEDDIWSLESLKWSKKLVDTLRANTTGRPGERMAELSKTLDRYIKGEIGTKPTKDWDASGIKSIADEVRTELIQRGYINLSGMTIKNRDEFAKLAQIWRDPNVERTSWVYTARNTTTGESRILDWEGYTLGSPGRTSGPSRKGETDQVVTSNEFYNRLKRLNNRVDPATEKLEVFQIHNHPQAVANPSPPDMRNASDWADIFDAWRAGKRHTPFPARGSIKKDKGIQPLDVHFGGSLIIDSGEFAWINPAKLQEVFKKDAAYYDDMFGSRDKDHKGVKGIWEHHVNESLTGVNHWEDSKDVLEGYNMDVIHASPEASRTAPRSKADPLITDPQESIIGKHARSTRVWNPVSKKIEGQYGTKHSHEARLQLIAAAAKEMDNFEGSVGVMFLTSRARVMALKTVPINMFRDKDNFTGWLRNQAREHGADDVYLYSDNMPAEVTIKGDKRYVDKRGLAYKKFSDILEKQRPLPAFEFFDLATYYKSQGLVTEAVRSLPKDVQRKWLEIVGPVHPYEATEEVAHGLISGSLAEDMTDAKRQMELRKLGTGAGLDIPDEHVTLPFNKVESANISKTLSYRDEAGVTMPKRLAKPDPRGVETPPLSPGPKGVEAAREWTELEKKFAEKTQNAFESYQRFNAATKRLGDARRAVAKTKAGVRESEKQVDEALKPVEADIAKPDQKKSKLWTVRTDPDGGLSMFEKQVLDSLVGDRPLDVLKQVFGPSNSMLEFNRSAGRFVENVHRMALYLDRRVKGKSPYESLKDVHLYHFDYNDLTDFERGVLGRVFPFYTWWRKNLGLQFWAMYNNPGRYSQIPKAINAIESISEDWQSVPTPDYYQETGAIRLPVKYDDKGVYWQPQFGYNDLNSMNFSSVISRLHPVLKATGEFTFADPEQGYDLFRERPRAQTGGKEASLIAAVADFLPPVGRAQRWGKTAKRGKADIALQTLSDVAGVRLRLNNPAQEEVRRLYKSSRLIDKFKADYRKRQQSWWDRILGVKPKKKGGK